MAHDHGEKIHTCDKCNYWHVAGGRFEQWTCPKCGDVLGTYSSRDYLIERDIKWEGIPKDKTWHFHAHGFVSSPSNS